MADTNLDYDSGYDDGYQEGLNNAACDEAHLDDYTDYIEELAKFINNWAPSEHYAKVIMNKLLKAINSNMVVK